MLDGWRQGRRGEPAQSYTYRLPAGDDSGVRALAELRSRGLAATAHVVQTACDDILWLFRQLRGELAFYVGCLNLHDRLTAIGAPTCFPTVVAGNQGPARGDPACGDLHASDLYDASLALTVGHPVVGNDLEADGADLVVITGANQGGKTTFLRSVGTAQLLAQCGVFVPARSFRGSLVSGVFTHFRRGEDAGMRRGKLDEELARMRDIVDALEPSGMLLLNESFASTNEREGSELARQIVAALTESGVRILFVTHLSQFARGLHGRGRPGTRFLRAERRPDGIRTFRMVAGAPTRTSHAEDLYRQLVPPRPAPRASDPTLVRDPALGEDAPRASDPASAPGSDPGPVRGSGVETVHEPSRGD
jgi:DNA mismatch repair ATPase MutS